jgi:LmbE family N-acetylglucosaminyl deacetylase
MNPGNAGSRNGAPAADIPDIDAGPALTTARPRDTGEIAHEPMSVRRVARRIGWSLLARRAPEWSPRDLGGSSVVFSPHFDDETLGAGAAIMKLRQSGTPVHIVFMTDGSRSHAGAMPEADLSATRRHEGLRAAAALGVDAGHVTFLDYPETRLEEHRDEAARRVAELLVELDCHRVFVPSALEPDIWSTDHLATTDVVFEALARTGRDYEVLEYLIWFWYHWPWVPLLGTGDARQLLKFSWRHRFGLRALRAANVSIKVEGFRTRKQKALEQHRTQVTRFVTDRPWPILADVGRGEFLDIFFRSPEWFRLSPWKGSADAR